MRKSQRRAYFAPARAAGDQLEMILWDAITGELPLRDEADTMHAPLVSISKNMRTKPIEWTSPRGDRVIVSGGQYGIATIWDWDLVIYAISQINDKIERGDPDPGPRFRFHPHDALRILGRSTRQEDYKRLDDAINRLRTTEAVILRSGEKKAERGLAISLISEAEWEKDEEGRLLWIEIQVPPTLYNAIHKNRSVLAISPDYFSLTGGLERAIYRKARKMAGKTSWRVGFSYLKDSVGSESEQKFFNHALRKIIAGDRLPDYRLEEERGTDGPVLVMIHRSVDLSVDKLVDKYLD